MGKAVKKDKLPAAARAVAEAKREARRKRKVATAKQGKDLVLRPTQRRTRKIKKRSRRRR